MKKKLLLHSCCGPCSTHCISVLCDEYDVTVFYYNPNILPEEEYIKRKDEQIRFINEFNIKSGNDIHFIEYDYTPDVFHQLAKGIEEEPERSLRCCLCISHRLDVTARFCEINSFDLFTTTLTVSPHKDAEFINMYGVETAKKYDVTFLPCDFKKKDGYKHSIEMSKEYGLYRQNYCGCGLGKYKK